MTHTDRQTDRQTDTQTDRHTHTLGPIATYSVKLTECKKVFKKLQFFTTLSPPLTLEKTDVITAHMIRFDLEFKGVEIVVYTVS